MEITSIEPNLKLNALIKEHNVLCDAICPKCKKEVRFQLESLEMLVGMEFNLCNLCLLAQYREIFDPEE